MTHMVLMVPEVLMVRLDLMVQEALMTRMDLMVQEETMEELVLTMTILHDQRDQERITLVILLDTTSSMEWMILKDQTVLREWTQ